MIASSRTSSIARRQPYMPPPGLHRLNRTEYTNMVRDMLDLEIDAGEVPALATTRRPASTTSPARSGISSTLVEAYVTAAQKISRLAIG